VDQQALDLE